MKLNRISPWIIAAAGIVLSLLAVAGLGFGLIKPALDSMSVQQARYDQNHPDSTPQAQLLAKKQLDAAKQQVQQIKFQWAVKDAALMPRFDVSDRFKALRQITYELTRVLGPDLDHQLKTTGVVSTSAIALPAPPASPNDITNAPIVIPLGTITVNGDFRHILTHFYEWQSFNRLVMVDSLAFNGSSPYMQGTYTATLYIFPQNDDKLAPTIPQAGTGTAGTGAGGGFGGAPGGYGGGGPGGGFPGGPPGGFRGGAPGGPPPGTRGG